MTVFNGKLITGFGDYNANTGPIGINPFDMSLVASFDGVALNCPSESTEQLERNKRQSSTQQV
jgi:hypothetical protein